MNKTILVYKPRSLTPLQTISLFKKQYPSYNEQTVSYAGRLDPMAEGLLLLLIGDANKERRDYEQLAKTYDFSFLLGLTTDTYDVLGRTTHFFKTTTTTPKELEAQLILLRGQRQQPYPPYSSMHVKGKPLFFWAREGRLNEITIPAKEVTIHNLSLLSISSICLSDITIQILQDIKKVRGDFRQDLIIKDWRSLTTTYSDKKLQLITCEAKVSSGTYIRSLVHDLGEKLGCGAIAYQIKRSGVGDYLLKDALIL